MKRSLPLIIIGCIGLLIFIFLLNFFFPHNAANLKITKSEAIDVATRFLIKRGCQLEDYDVVAVPRYADNAFIYLQEQYGLKRAREIFQKEENVGLDPGWRILWFKDLPRSVEYEQFNVFVSSTGKITAFNHIIPVTSDWPEGREAHLSQEKALVLARDFLEKQKIRMADYKKLSFTSFPHEKRTDHSFSWVKEYNSGETKINLNVIVRGDEVGRFRIIFGIPQSRSMDIIRQVGHRSVVATGSFIFCFIFFMVLLVLFLKKYHDGEISVKTAAIMFIVVWSFLLVESILKFRVNGMGVEMGETSVGMMTLVIFAFLVLIIWPFYSIMAFVSWSVGESLGRERFNLKFTALDSILNGKFTTLNVAHSAINGYFAGFTGLGLLAVFISAFIHFFGVKIGINGYSRLFSSEIPMLVPAITAVSTALISELTFRLFGNLFIYRYLKSKWGSIFLSSFLWVIFAFSIWDINVQLYSIFWEWILLYGVGLFLGYLFWKYDLLTVIVADFVMVGVMKSLPMVLSDTGSVRLQGVISLGLLALPVIIIIRGLIRKVVFSFEVDLTPEHIKRITERVRMAKELEIARQVQIQLLPVESPKFANMEIEGICIPANEIGGDYYDFIPIDDSKLAVVIGDVSGKGVPAAIYMTLTKGIIQTQAENKYTPEEVLTRVNHSLYSMMDHKSFVTLFYAVIDVKHMTLEFCRAGHNPLLHIRSSDGNVAALRPRGIALGLQKRKIFNDLIREGNLQLKAGDLLVFYTDGFSEAMNKDQEEYGEKRLAEVIKNNKDLPLKDILDAVVRDVRSFEKGNPQHDDMTMVLVRISASCP